MYEKLIINSVEGSFTGKHLLLDGIVMDKLYKLPNAGDLVALYVLIVYAKQLEKENGQELSKSFYMEKLKCSSNELEKYIELLREIKIIS